MTQAHSGRSLWNRIRSGRRRRNGKKSPPPRPLVRRLWLEPLEDRTLLSASFGPDPGNPGMFIVQFGEDFPGTADTLVLRQNNGGELEYNLNGAGFTNDLDSTTLEIEALSFNAISKINVALGGGDDTLNLDNTNGLVIPQLSGIHYDGGAGTDTIACVDGDQTLTDAALTLSVGRTVTLVSVERAHLTGNNTPNHLDASGFSGNVTLDGGNQNDILIGGSGDDTFIGQEGTDMMFGNGGNDTFLSGNSGTTAFGGDGDDLFIGGNGKDVFFGEGGNDTLIGNNGADFLDGGAGDDIIEGGGGNDEVLGGPGTDTVLATGDNNITITDKILTGLGTDTLDSIEKAIITGGPGNHTFDGAGFSGDLTLDAGSGRDTLIGGTGVNTFLFAPGSQVTIITNGSTADDTIKFDKATVGITLNLSFSTGQAQTLDAQGNTMSLFGTVETVIGSAFSDVFIGNAANNLLFGEGGDDELHAGAGNDGLFGGDDDGNDLLFGEDGDDVLHGGGGNDGLFGGEDDGNDLLFGEGGDDEMHGGAGNDGLFGGDDDGNDLLFGEDGDDALHGGGGNDGLFGGDDDGNDLLFGEGGDDEMHGGAGNDGLFGGEDDGNDLLFGEDGDDVLHGGGGKDGLFGGDDDGNDLLFGEDGDDELHGGAGSDGLFGGDDDGNDLLFGEDGDDVLDGGAGNDGLFGGDDDGNDLLFGEDGDDVLHGGAGNDGLFGGDDAGNDLLFGEAGNDMLAGGAGPDQLDGGAGNDTYLFIGGGLGSDLVVEAANLDADTLDFSGFIGAVTVDLALTTAQVVNPGNLTLTFSSSTGIENVVGSKFADFIFGNDRDNVLTGADFFDDRFGGAPGWNGVTQVVFLDFDTFSDPGEHVYTQAQRDEIEALIELDFAFFHFQITQTLPSSGAFATLFFNKTPVVDGVEQPGGQSDEIDFRNLNLGGTAAIDVNDLLGGLNQPPASVANFVFLSATVGAHELGHLLGLRHSDSFGPIGSGIFAAVDPARFLPAYPGPAQGFETNRHLMASPASVGETLFDAAGDQFWGEREAIRLAFNEGGTTVAETIGVHNSLATAQALSLVSLAVPNTLVTGLNFGKDFAVAAFAVTGSINLVGGVSEDDFYSFTGRAGDLLNLEIISGALVSDITTRNTNPIDSIIHVYDSSGVLVPYYGVPAENDDELENRDSILIDLILPADGTYFIQVDTFTNATVPDNDDGNYELYVSRFDAGNATDLGDFLDGRAGNDILKGYLGDDTLIGGTGINTLDGGAGTDKVIETGNVNFTLTDTSLTGPGTTTLASVEQAQLTGGASGNTFNISGWTGTAVLDGQGGGDTLIAANTVNTWNITANNAGTINSNVTFTSMENLVGGTSADSFVFGNGVGVSGSIGGQGGSDTLNYGANTAALTWNISSANAGNVNGFSFTSVENLASGAGNDRFTFANGASVAGTVNGGGGSNFLDYAAFTSSVTVNLVASTATGTGGVSNLQNALGGSAADSFTGSSANNIFVGNGGNDSLLGNDGRDLLIGGMGGDLVDGGNDDDIVIGNRTTHDASIDALSALMAEWGRTDLGYLDRINHLSGAVGGGLNGAFLLNASTVLDDNKTMDILFGRGGLDWFFQGIKDDVKDKESPAETVTKL